MDFEFIQAFQNMEIPGKASTMLVVLTSSVNITDMERARSLGIKHIIGKPLTSEDVCRLSLQKT